MLIKKIGPYLVVVIVVLAIIFFTSKKLKELFQHDYQKDLKKEINEKDLSYNTSRYKNIADSLFAAMDGMGTDYDTIIRNLKLLKTKSDWLKLQYVFGLRKEQTLVEWLINDLSEGDEIAEVNSILMKFNISL